METNSPEEERYFYESICKQIEREDALVNTRLTWMLTTQGFLFASLALIKANESPDLYNVLKLYIPVTGFALSIIGFLGVWGANKALKQLKNSWNLFNKKSKFVQPFGTGNAGRLGKVPSIALPLLLAVIWVIIFFYLNNNQQL